MVYSTGEIFEIIGELGNLNFQFEEGWDTEEVGISNIRINEKFNNGGLLIDSYPLLQFVKFINLNHLNYWEIHQTHLIQLLLLGGNRIVLQILKSTYMISKVIL